MLGFAGYMTFVDTPGNGNIPSWVANAPELYVNDAAPPAVNAEVIVHPKLLLPEIVYVT